MRPSTWITGRFDRSERYVALPVHGCADDALRIVASLADGLRACDPEAAKACLSPRSSWTVRFRAATALLNARSTDSAPPSMVVINPDGLPLAPPRAGEESWNDRAFLTARHSLGTLLLNHAQSAGDVTFVRPCPESELTRLLGANGVVAADEPEDELVDLRPFCRPLAKWLVGTSILSQEALFHWVRSLSEPDLGQLVMEAALDSLPAQARSTLYRLSILRGSQPYNGFLGPFVLDGRRLALSIQRETVGLLVDAGWLQPAAVGPGLEIPAALRDFLVPRAKLVADPRADHRSIAEADLPRINEVAIPEALEIHHHAIEAGEVEIAIRSGRCYVNDLRELAFDLSVKRREYETAAGLYRAILDHDDGDAYAHEYLAHNLQKVRHEDPFGDEILGHFDRARQLDPGNPLFIGRWIACRAGRGENVAPELIRLLHRFHKQGPTAVSYLARTPLLRMDPSQRSDVARQWSWLLEGDEQLRKLIQ